MAVYYNGNKILDLKVLGLDQSKVYTKEEIDTKVDELTKNITTNSNKINSTNNYIESSVVTKYGRNESDVSFIGSEGVCTIASFIDSTSTNPNITINDATQIGAIAIEPNSVTIGCAPDGFSNILGLHIDDTGLYECGIDGIGKKAILNESMALTIKEIEDITKD